MYFSVITLVLLTWTTSVQSRPAFSSADSHSQVNQNITLTSNITLQGDICPVGVQLNCFVPDQPSLTWFFENKTVVTFTPKDYHRYPHDLCEHHVEEHPLLREMCAYHGKLSINNATQSENDKDLYSISSTFELRMYFLHNRGDQYSFVACGSNEHNMETLPTNFTVNCNDPETPEVEIASTSTDTELCTAGTEITCNGTDLPSLTWSSNTGPYLNETYVYNITTKTHFPLELTVSVPGVKIRVDSASKSNDYSSWFSFSSTLIFTESVHSVDYVSCGSAQKTEKIHFHCAASGVSQGFRDFCSVNVTVPWTKVLNYKCYGIFSAIIAAGILYFLLQCCCGYWYPKCCKRSRSGYHPLSQNTTSDPASEATTPETVGYIVNQDRDITQSIGSTSSHSQSKKTPERGKSPASEINPDHTDTDRFSGESIQMRAVERADQERRERKKADSLVQSFLQKNYQMYGRKSQLPDIGSRLQKYYYKTHSIQTSLDVLLTIAPLPKNCSLTDLEFDLDVINRRILPTLIAHPLIHKVHRICDAGNSSNQVIVVQEIAHGSLRDKLYRNKYELDWSKKYTRERKVLKADEVAKYGGQILEALLFLYAQGFPPLGHIHTGNIFITDRGCTLAGYDNTLLGYRSSFYRLFGKNLDQNLLDSIDVIMFGRVIFEMSSKTDLLQLLPDEADLATVANTEIRKVLRFIFEVDEEGKMKNSIEMVSQHPFFAEHVGMSMMVSKPIRDDPHVRRVLTLSDKSSKDKVKTKEQIEAKLNRIIGRMKQLEDADVESLPTIGRRPRKYWRLIPSTQQLISLAKVSETCPVVLIPATVTTINSLLEKCAECNLLQQCELHFDSYVVFIQPLRKKSLHDVLFETEPLRDWLEKDRAKGGVLEKNNVAVISTQILKAVLVLYKAGFPALGHITTGNIFLVDGNTFVLGGYENTLLGYPSQFDFGEQYKEFVDVIMFGHVVYEMGSGRKLQGMTPSAEEYEQVRDRDVRGFLKFVFDMDGETFTHSIEKIYQHMFIKEGRIPLPVIETTEDIKNLLAKVRKDKVRDNSKFGRFRYGVKSTVQKSVQIVKSKAKTLTNTSSSA